MISYPFEKKTYHLLSLPPLLASETNDHSMSYDPSLVQDIPSVTDSISLERCDCLKYAPDASRAYFSVLGIKIYLETICSKLSKKEAQSFNRLFQQANENCDRVYELLEKAVTIFQSTHRYSFSYSERQIKEMATKEIKPITETAQQLIDALNDSSLAPSLNRSAILDYMDDVAHLTDEIAQGLEIDVQNAATDPSHEGSHADYLNQGAIRVMLENDLEAIGLGDPSALNNW